MCLCVLDTAVSVFSRDKILPFALLLSVFIHLSWEIRGENCTRGE